MTSLSLTNTPPRLIRFRAWAKVWDAADMEALTKADPYPSAAMRYQNGHLTEEGERLHVEWSQRRPAALAAIAKWRMHPPGHFAFTGGDTFGWGSPDPDGDGDDTNVAAADRIILQQDTGLCAADVEHVAKMADQMMAARIARILQAKADAETEKGATPKTKSAR